MNLPEGWEAIPTKDRQLLELYAARYNWLRGSIAARVVIGTEVLDYEKLIVPMPEWLDVEIDKRICQGGVLTAAKG